MENNQKVFNIWDKVFFNRHLVSWTLAYSLTLAQLKPSEWVIVWIQQVNRAWRGIITRYTMQDWWNYYDDIHTITTTLDEYLEYIAGHIEKKNSGYERLKNAIKVFFAN